LDKDLGFYARADSNVYIDVDIYIDIVVDNISVIIMCSDHPPFPRFRHWMRHMASVPKGFLRYTVLRLLKDQAMSGSEIMNAIEEQTHKRWRPSPGSVYPLLAWFRERGYTQDVESQEPGIKRYKLTTEGAAFLEQLGNKRRELRQRFGLFAPPFMESIDANHGAPHTSGFIEAGQQLIRSSWLVLDRLRDRYSEEVAKKAATVLKTAAQQLDEIADQIATGEK
jgi:DNA-binding PadR family transcriptional regulator